MQPTDKSYEYWRVRILYSTMIGYVLFYFVRKNLSMAMPLMEADLGITKAQLGGFLTAHGLLYGISKFANGVWADRANPRYFMAAGLLVCAIANFGFGMSSAVWYMGVFWLVNAWFQGMGFPPCAKSLTHWFSPDERGVTMSIWNTSHSVGAGLVFLLNAGILIAFHDNWRFCFFVPGALALLGTLFLLDRLRDSPETMGLEPIEIYDAKKKGLSSETIERLQNEACEEPVSDRRVALYDWWKTLYENAFSNPAIWIVCLSNFFIYIIRGSILDWAPTILKETRGIEVHLGGVVASAYELTGVLGMLVSGWMMDKTFKGRGAKVCFLYMLGCAATITVFWRLQSESIFINIVLLAMIGFFIYGPQCLTGAIIANLATKKVASGAIGLGALFAYASTAVTGYGVGKIVDGYGWDAVFRILVVSALIGAVLFLFVLNAAAPERLVAEKFETETPENNG